MRLVNFNVRHGGGSRRARIAEAVLKHEPDVVVLTEYRPAPEFDGLLSASGLVYRVATEPPKGMNGVAVFSNTPIEPTGRASSAPENPPGRWIEARLPVHDVSLVAVYLPGATSGTGIPGKQEFWRALHAAATTYGTDDAIIVGDLNTGAHRIDEVGATLKCAGEFVEMETVFGWRDAWRHMHGDRVEYSWWSTKKGGGPHQGFRLDHIFVSPTALPRVVACDYSQTERENGISDHALQTLSLNRIGVRSA